MSFLKLIRLRTVVLFGLWVLPVAIYVAIGLFAVYETGWLPFIVISLPIVWLTTWLVARFWKAPTLSETHHLQPMQAPKFWTAKDADAIKVVEAFRSQVADIDRFGIAEPQRYISDAQEIASRLAAHYHADAKGSAFDPITIVEIFTVIHLAVEDLEEWTIENLPGSNIATLGHIQKVPSLAKALDVGQTIAFLATTIANPTKILAYPLWRKSGQVTVELQNELVRAFYQRYLRQIGYYLIEMYSGRLKGGSEVYRERFGKLANALHQSRGDTAAFTQLETVDTTIAIMGQVKAGKSSLVNALMRDKVAITNILPETREVQKYRFELPGSTTAITLLDTPGYSEAGVSKQQRNEVKLASEKADIVLLVLAANSSAREADLAMAREIRQHYREHEHLNAPTIIVVLTHIDLLRPIREWSPPYNWKNPESPKEHSIAQSAAYVKELFGDQLAGIACVYTGEVHSSDTSVADELVPQLVDHLPSGQSAAILRAFYQQLSKERYRLLTKQVTGLIKTIGKRIIE